MKIDLTNLSPVKKRMSVEIPPEAVEREAKSLLRDYRKKARIPGFRRGKAPAAVVRARFSKEMEDDLRERVVSASFLRAAKEQGLRPLGDPALEDVTHEEGEPLTFQTTFEVLPEIELQGYREIEVTRRSQEVSDEDLERTLEELRQSRVKLVVEAGRQAVEGDVVIVDVEGVPAEGEPFQRDRMPIEVGAKSNLPEFNDQLVGVQSGAELDFPVEYPTDYRAPDLAGKRVGYHLTVHEVKRPELPELDDEFARDLGDFDDLVALRAKLRKDLEARRVHEADLAVRQSVLDKVLIANPVVLPEVLVESELRRRLQDVVRNMIVEGLDPEKVEVDWVELRKRQLEPSRKAVHARLVLDALAEAEDIRVEDKEVEERIVRDAKRLGQSPAKLRADLKQHSGMQALTAQLVREKSLDYLNSVANIQYSDEGSR